MNTTACPDEEQLVRMVEGALAQDSLSQIESHVDTCESCAAVLAGLGGLEQSQVRRTLGRYQLDRRIAAGGMGEVWAAWDPQLRRELAIKFVRPDRADDGRERDRLLREARALARLTHPNVLAVHDVGEIDGEVFLVTELVAGDTLATRGGPSSDWRVLVRLYAQAARGLAAAHAAGLVHRDVKPANLLLGADGRVRVADFGLAIRSNTPSPVAPTEMPSVGASSVITAAGHIAGTPAYMAPEQRAGLGAEGPADQFALCVALGEGIAGRRPPTAPEREALRQFIAERRTIDTELDALCTVLARGLALDPDDRFPSMAALADALEAIAGPGTEAIGTQPSGRMRVPSGQHRSLPPDSQRTNPTGSQRTAPDLDRITANTRRSPVGVIALVLVAAAAISGGLYFALRGRGDAPSTTHPASSSNAVGSNVAPSNGTAGSSSTAAGAVGSNVASPSGNITSPGSGNAASPSGNAASPSGNAGSPSTAAGAPGGGSTPASGNTASPASAASARSTAASPSGGAASPGSKAAGAKTRPLAATNQPPTVADADDSEDADDPDDPTRNGPGMKPRPGAAATPTAGSVTLQDVNRAVQRRDGKACRAALAKLTTPPPTDFRVASAHAVCEMVAGDCEGGKREERALAIREGSGPAGVDITAELYCSVNDPDPAVRLSRLSRQLSMFTWFECSYYLPAARASGKVVANDRERMQVGSALATIAKCYSDHDDCPTAHKILGEAQAFIPKLGLSELNGACR